jgi:hypothetical protein
LKSQNLVLSNVSNPEYPESKIRDAKSEIQNQKPAAELIRWQRAVDSFER